MAKRVDPLVAKKAKQKKLAIILSVLLVGVVAFQGPKMLKMMKGPSATPAAAPATPTPSGTADPSAPAGAAPVVPAQEAVLADSDVAPDAESGQLLSVDTFSTKDPFAQQLTEAVPSETPIPAAPDSAPTTPNDSDENEQSVSFTRQSRCGLSVKDRGQTRRTYDLRHSSITACPYLRPLFTGPQRAVKHA